MVSMRSGRRLLALVGVIALAATACNYDWSQFGYDAGHSHASPETAITTGNVGGLGLAWTAALGPAGAAVGGVSVARGVVYSAGGNGVLSAFDATGTSGCSGAPKACTPLWTATVAGQVLDAPTVGGGTVFVDSRSGTVSAFDASGTTGCSGSPKTCTPLWTASVGTAVGGTGGGIVVADGILYLDHDNIPAGPSGNDRTDVVAAFDAAGSTGCGGSPKTCSPLWSATLGFGIATIPAIANGVLYAGGGSPQQLFAFDAPGTTGCSGSPTTCTPLWSAPVPTWSYAPATVANGVVYVATDGAGLFAFDAAGTTGCAGVPKTCAPLWRTAVTDPMGSSAAVANGVVYIGTGESGVTFGSLDAFDATGTTGCSGSPKTCQPLWTAGAGANGASGPMVAGGVVFASTAVQGLQAFDAAGTVGCSGAPKDCTALWTSPIGSEYPSVVSGGTVYVSSADGTLQAYTTSK